MEMKKHLILLEGSCWKKLDINVINLNLWDGFIHGQEEQGRKILFL